MCVGEALCGPGPCGSSSQPVTEEAAKADQGPGLPEGQFPARAPAGTPGSRVIQRCHQGAIQSSPGGRERPALEDAAEPSPASVSTARRAGNCPTPTEGLGLPQTRGARAPLCHDTLQFRLDKDS